MNRKLSILFELCDIEFCRILLVVKPARSEDFCLGCRYFSDKPMPPLQLHQMCHLQCLSLAISSIFPTSCLQTMYKPLLFKIYTGNQATGVKGEKK